MNKMAILALGIVAIMGFATLTSAIGNFGENNMFDETINGQEKMNKRQGPMFNSEEHNQIQKTIENNDFETWNLLKSEQITEEKFNEIIQRHTKMQEYKEEIDEARRNGDFEKVQEIKEERGFKSSMGRGNKRNQLSGDCLRDE